MVDALLPLLVTFTTWAALASFEKPTSGRLVGVGMLIGLCALARPTALVWLIILATWLVVG